MLKKCRQTSVFFPCAFCAWAISWTGALPGHAVKCNAMPVYAEVRASLPALDVLSGCLWSPALAGQLLEGWVETVAAVFVLAATEVSKHMSMCCMPG